MAFAATLAACVATSTPAFAAPLKWTDTKPPAMSSNYAFSAIDGAGAQDVWAVGYTVSQSWNGTVASHWDGKAWKQASTPTGLAFNGVSAVSATDAWAVGLTDKGGLTARWDGTKWSEVASPRPKLPAGQLARLFGVDAVSANDAWAVGYGADDGEETTTAYLQHWDGSQWKIVDTPTVPARRPPACGA